MVSLDSPQGAEVAKEAGLYYITDRAAGITRTRTGKSFRYFDPDGERVTDRAALNRIKSLAIPPAWTDVWISPRADGHIQATGRDAAGRKQYRYHPRWRTVRDDAKYGRMVAFGKTLPAIRKHVEHDLSLPDMPREKVLATVVRLLETTLIRVGNDEYARANKHYGLTTMLNRHVKVEGSQINFRFRGKSGIKHDIDVDDRRLARAVKRTQELPGQRLFEYRDESGKLQAVDSSDVNDYLAEITGEDFTSKDFRTWAGTVLAAIALQELPPFDTQAAARRNIVRAIESVAERLGNTPAVCRKCYVHPAVLEAYIDGTLIETLNREADDELASSRKRLKPEEAAVLVLLRDRPGHASETP